MLWELPAFVMNVLGIVITYKETKLCEQAIRSLVNAGVDVALVVNGWCGKYSSWLNKIKELTEFVYLSRYNAGFCRGNNKAMSFAIDRGYDYVFLLNNDAWVEQDCLDELINVMEKDKRVGLVQPKVYKAWNKNILDTTGHVFMYGEKYSWENGLGFLEERGEMEFDEGQYDSFTDILSCSACAVMYRVKMLREIGLFWERLWSVCEDIELSWRAHKYGWLAKFVPEAVAYHWRGYTSGVNKKNKNKKNSLWNCIFYRNWILTLRRHASYNQKIFENRRLLLVSLKCSIGRYLGTTQVPGKFVYFCSKSIFNDQYLYTVEKYIFSRLRHILKSPAR